jgi:prevent-host-death family protein
MTKTAEVKDFSGKLADLVEQVQAGNEVVLTQDHQPVAKIVPTTRPNTNASNTLQIKSLKGHRVLTPVISQSEIADELFGR